MARRDAKGEDVWEALAKEDALWAACTSGKRRLDWQLDEFLATGEREVAWATRTAEEDSFYPRRKSLAVDFGCGPGRLIGPLSASFQRVVAVDTSPTMLSLAKTNNPQENVSFSESTAELADDSVDLIYSTFVLQHIAPDELDGFLHEFSRILSPQGLLIFQYPASPRWTLSGIGFRVLPAALLDAIQRYLVHYPGMMPMTWMPPAKIARHAATCGLAILDYRSGPRYSPNWKDVWYFAGAAGATRGA
jgi:SAM-dependent methyltransferase